MTHRVLLTALYGDGPQRELSYYCTKDFGEKTLYCDAVTPTEAGCKYMLSAYQIDEIIVLGMDGASQPEDEEPVVLRKQDAGFLFEPEKNAAFSALQYRLLQFFDEVDAEAADQNDLLGREEQEQMMSFLRGFFRERVDSEGEKKHSRYFHYLIQDPNLLGELEDALAARLANPEEDLARYRAWILHYLYRNLKATNKFEPLDRNGAVRIRRFPVQESGVLEFLNRLMALFRGMEIDDGLSDDIELYICLQNEHLSGMFALMNAMNLTKVMPGAQIRIARVVTEAHPRGLSYHELQDKTGEYNISELLSATWAFLRYGKTDLLVEYWQRANLQNPKIERIIYAMRNIDSGISLCDIADLERGIRSLRSVIRNDLPIGGKTVIEQYFEIVVENVRQDYGPLLEADRLSFVDLVKWAYRKGFWQQTLTLIESRAPQDFVDNGFFFYSDGERSRRHAVEVLGQVYYDLRPFEKYKLDDVSHYYIKYYNRNRASRSASGDSYQMSYAEVRVGELDTHDENAIRALTICPDRSALKDLLFAYYHLGDVRNHTNHAMEEYSGFYTIMADDDPGERMKTITQAVDFFIHSYDRVSDLTRGKKANVVTVATSELADRAQALREKNRRDRDSAPENATAQNQGKT